jgi:hypothetical protein
VQENVKVFADFHRSLSLAHETLCGPSSGKMHPRPSPKRVPEEILPPNALTAPSINYGPAPVPGDVRFVRKRVLFWNISSDFLKLAAEGNRGFFSFFKSWVGAQLCKSVGAWQISPLVVHSLMTLRDRRKYSVSPWTGTMVRLFDPHAIQFDVRRIYHDQSQAWPQAAPHSVAGNHRICIEEHVS